MKIIKVKNKRKMEELKVTQTETQPKVSLTIYLFNLLILLYYILCICVAEIDNGCVYETVGILSIGDWIKIFCIEKMLYCLLCSILFVSVKRWHLVIHYTEIVFTFVAFAYACFLIDFNSCESPEFYVFIVNTFVPSPTLLLTLLIIKNLRKRELEEMNLTSKLIDSYSSVDENRMLTMV